MTKRKCLLKRKTYRILDAAYELLLITLDLQYNRYRTKGRRLEKARSICILIAKRSKMRCVNRQKALNCS